MPIDEYGIRADIWIDMNSPVARNNPGQLYEMGINRISEFVRRKVEQINISNGSEMAFTTLMDWYNDVNPMYSKRIKEVATHSKDRKDLVKEAIEHGPKLWIPPFLETLCPTDDEFWNALINIQNWAEKWDVKSSRVTYKTMQADGSFKEFTTETEFSIGSKYMIHLHKLPEITAPGPAMVNHIGVPTKSTTENKYFPVSLSPYRYGEDELRVMTIDTDIREVVRFQNLMANSPDGVCEYIKCLLTVDHPTRIARVPRSNGELLNGSAVLKIYHNTTAVLGVETKDTKIDQIFIPDELADSIYDTDTINYGNGDSTDEDDEGNSVTSKRAVNKRNKLQKMLRIEQDEEVDPDPIPEDVEEDA
jgi:hypothetical protein